MRRCLPLLALVIFTAPAFGHGLLIPADKTVPPLAMLNHQVTINIEDQVAVTKVEQTFRNHTERPLEATYIFPVPKGASVQNFSMWVDGKEVKGELVEADKARQIYTDIVRRTQDPGLLEYMGNNVLRLRVFPVPAKNDQKVSVRYSAVAQREKELVEYIYPLKTDGKAVQTLEKFSLDATIKSQHPIQNVYSPTHAITLKRTNDKEVKVSFSRDQALLDKDFQLFYSMGDKDVGLTALVHKPITNEAGYFSLLISPRVELPKGYEIPRDVVLVLDTSGSMRGPKMDQAKKALRYCLDHLGSKDRFGIINFATTVNQYKEKVVDADSDQLEQARKWVDNLEATGGTAIDDALTAAMKMRESDDSRTFTIVFFTDGQPTIGETVPEKILKNVAQKNTANTRIFTFGVGDDVNATMLDQLADNTRAVSTYVRPAEDIEVKASGLYDKISHPVLANLKLSVEGDAVKLSEIYPPQLPDLFHGGQLVVLGRYTGKGHAAIKLTGTVGKEQKEFVYEVNFAEKTNSDREFVEHLWARRKVGYMLDQIRANGAKKELVDEVVILAKKYGIATPYTSYLVVPDGPTPVVTRPHGVPIRKLRNSGPEALAPRPGAAEAPRKVADFAKEQADDGKGEGKGGGVAKNREKYEADKLNKPADPNEGAGSPKDDADRRLRLAERKKQYSALTKAREAFGRGDVNGYQAGEVGVDLSIQSNQLKSQNQLTRTAVKNVGRRNCLEIGGVWIDEGFNPSMKTVVVKAQSNAYFRMLERRPELKEVFKLGNHLVWVAPSGTALVIDTNDGKEELSDADIDALFAAKK
jgi:Ca-activated chloride channel family protein